MLTLTAMEVIETPRPKKRGTRVKKPTRKLDPLKKRVGDLANSSAAMMVIAEMAPDRMTLSQAIFFVTAAAAIIAGKQPTYSDIQEAIGDEVNRSLHTTYRVFLEPSRVYPRALNWISRETNPADNRQKIFSLTPRGRAVVEEMLRALPER